MTTTTRTPEQQREYDSKVVLADALNELRANLGTAIRDLREALDTLSNVENSLKEIPDDIDAESIDVSVIVYALALADDEWSEPINVRSIQGDIDEASGNLSEAVGQVDYLEAGDFSE